MKIVSLELFKVAPRWLFLKTTADDGTVGWGEPVIEGRADTVAAAVQELSPYVVGRDPAHIEDIFQTLYRGGFYRGGPVRERIQVYCWIGGDRPDDTARAAVEKSRQGYHAVKMNATAELDYLDSWAKVEAAVGRVAAIRDALGPDFGIAVDFHGRVHQAMARVLMKELEPYHLMFIEEPVLIENIEAFAELRRHTSTPIATGERNFTRWGFKDIITKGIADIIQPDLCHAGGIAEVRKIAAMAECFDIAVAPHCPLGPVALAACLQLDYCTPNAVIQEQSLGIHYNQGADMLDYLQDKSVFNYKDGSVFRSRLPGLGVTVNEEKLREAAKIGHSWKNPVWRTEDGVVAEW